MELLIIITFFLLQIVNCFDKTFVGKFYVSEFGTLDKFLLINDNGNNHLEYDKSTDSTTSHEFLIKDNTLNYAKVSPDGTKVCYLRKDSDCDNLYFFGTNAKKCLGTYSKDRTIREILCFNDRYIFIYEKEKRYYFWKYDNQNRYDVNSDFSFTGGSVFLHIKDRLLVISQLDSASYYGIFFNLDTMYYESSTPLQDITLENPIGTPVDSNTFIICDYDQSKTVSCFSGFISDSFVITLNPKGEALKNCNSPPKIAQIGDGSAAVGCDQQLIVISSDIVYINYQANSISTSYPIVSLLSYSQNAHSIMVGSYDGTNNNTYLKEYSFKVHKDITITIIQPNTLPLKDYLEFNDDPTIYIVQTIPILSYDDGNNIKTLDVGEKQLSSISFNPPLQEGQHTLKYTIKCDEGYSGIYNFIVNVCYHSCKSCDIAGDSTNHQCKECADGSHSLKSNTKNCYFESDKPDNVYLEGSEYVECYSTCAKCNQGGTLTQHNCLECIKDTYFVGDKNSNCKTLGEIPGNYYYNKTEGVYKECYSTCDSCEMEGTADKHNCLSCKKGYYFLNENSANCINSIPKGYYLDSFRNRLTKCYTTCASCKKGGKSERHNCEECLNGYVFNETSPYNCVPKNTTPENYYLDTTEPKTFRKCYETCGSCVKGGDNSNNNCQSCAKGYYKLEGKPTQCAKTETKPNNYYYYHDENVTEYRKCYQSCSTCEKGGNETEHNCSDCAEGHYKIKGSSNNCYLYGSSNVSKYYLDVDLLYKPCYKNCLKCSQQGDVSNNNCDQCISGTFRVSDKVGQCVEKCEERYFTDNKNKKCIKCYETCKECLGAGNDTVHNCKTCDDKYAEHPVFSNNCVEKIDNKTQRWYLDDKNTYYSTPDLNCPSHKATLEKTRGQCVESCSNTSTCLECKNKDKKKYFYNFECVEECPQGTKNNNDTFRCDEKVSFGTSKSYPDQIFASSSTTSYELKGCPMNEFEKDINKAVMMGLLSSTPVNMIKGDTYRFVMYDVTKKNSVDDSIPKVDLGECEGLIRQTYNLFSPSIIYIVQLITLSDDGSSDSYTYKVCDQKGSFLDLSCCDGLKVNKKQVVNEDELKDKGIDLEEAEKLKEQGVDIFDPNSELYSDHCFPYAIDGRDLCLEDRRETLFKNISFCDTGCEYKGIDLETMVVDCECNPQTDSPSDDILDSVGIGELTQTLNSFNLKFFTCFKVISLKNIYTNCGSWIIIGLFGIELVFGLGFIIFQMNSIYSFVYGQIYSTKRANDEVPSNPPKALENHAQIQNFSPTSGQLSFSEKFQSNEKINDKPEEKVEVKKKEEEKEEENETEATAEELNDMDFEDALEEDKRHFGRMMLDIIIVKQIIIRTIAEKNTFFPLALRVVLFLISITVHLFLNAILFTDTYISKRYKYEKEITILYILTQELSKCIYAIMFGIIVSRLLQFLTSSDKEFRKLKTKAGTKEEFQNICKKLVNDIKLKHSLLLGIFIIGNIACWYYITIFCIVYTNSQIAWLESSGITIGISLLFPVLLSFPIVILRSLALKTKISFIYTICGLLYDVL